MFSRITGFSKWMALGLLWIGIASASLSYADGTAPIPPSIGVAYDGEQGFSGHKINQVVPFITDYKLGPVFYLSAYQIEPYASFRFCGNLTRAGGGIGLSRFVLEPGNRGAGLRLVVDGGYYSGHQVLGQFGWVLDLDKLIRAGSSVGIGNKSNDHLFFMSTLGVDFIAVGRLIWPPSRPY